MAFKASTIFGIVMYILTLPLYNYAIWKWWQWRKHSFFRLRYSYPEGFALVLFSVALVHINLINYILSDFGLLSANTRYNLSVIALSLIYIIFYLVYYRANLIFLTWKQYQFRLHSMGISNGNTTVSWNAISPRRHCSSQALLVLAFGGAFLNLILYSLKSPFSDLTFFLWAFNYLVGVVIFIVVKVRKVQELIGCLYELYLVLAVIVCFWVILIFAPSDWLTVFGMVADHLYALVTLYFTLYFIYKSEGTLTSPSTNERIFAELSSMGLMGSVTVGTEENQSSKDELKEEMKEIESDIHDKPLHLFLNNRKDYEIFSKYLALFFCLENLMFIERVCVFRWLVLQKIEGHNCEISALQIDGKHKNSYYSLKFLFLEPMYEEYKNIIDTASDNEFMSNRSILWSFCHNIYKEFICDEAMNQINIPFLVRNEFENRLRSKENIDEDFKDYSDFLSVFNGSMEHTWKLLRTVYAFKFRMYLNTVNRQ